MISFGSLKDTHLVIFAVLLQWIIDQLDAACDEFHRIEVGLVGKI